MTTLSCRCTFALLAAAVLPLVAGPGAPLAPSPAAAVPLAAPTALRETAPPLLLQVKSLRKCKTICVKWKPCPPLGQPQPAGCFKGSYPNIEHLDQYCIKTRRICWLPSEGTHPPNRFHVSPPLLNPEHGLSPGGAPASSGGPPPGRGPSPSR